MSHFPESLADRYRRFKYRHFAPNMDHYETLATHGQAPEIMVVSCCDSRVAPNLITATQPGELFIVRNIGALVPPASSESGNDEGAAIEMILELGGG